jgi:hypothetical protein
MSDPLVTQVVMDANTITAIINNVNSIYSNVIAYTFGLVAFVGILLPIAISLLQNRQLKNDHKALSDKISKEMQEAKNALITDLKNELAIEISKFDKKVSDIKIELNEEIHEISSGLHAKAHHSQARDAIEKNNFQTACIDCLAAVVGYCDAKDEPNLQVVLDVLLIPKVIPKLKQPDFDNNENVEIYFNKALAALEKINTNGRYSKNIQSLKVGLKTAKARQN